MVCLAPLVYGLKIWRWKQQVNMKTPFKKKVKWRNIFFLTYIKLVWIYVARLWNLGWCWFVYPNDLDEPPCQDSLLDGQPRRLSLAASMIQGLKSIRETPTSRSPYLQKVQLAISRKNDWITVWPSVGSPNKWCMIAYDSILVGGLELFLFFHNIWYMGIILPIDYI